jgi:hypothetical protein
MKRRDYVTEMREMIESGKAFDYSGGFGSYFHLVSDLECLVPIPWERRAA